MWRHFHYDVIRADRAYGARNPRASYSHYDVILIVTSLSWPHPALRTNLYGHRL